MNTVELLESANLLDEHECIEAKHAAETCKSELETVGAFANERGLGSCWLALDVMGDEMVVFPAYEDEGVTYPGKIIAYIVSIPQRVNVSTERTYRPTSIRMSSSIHSCYTEQ